MDLFEKHYLAQLKLLSSTFSADHSHLSIFTHAPVGLKTIQEIAKYFGCKDCKIDSALEIHQTIKAINEAFSEVIKADDIHTLQSSCPFIEDLLWNRNNDIPTDPKPLTRGNTAIHYYNGHTSGPTSLDNPVGKEEMWFLKRHIQFICKLKTFSKQYHQCPELLEIFQAIQKDINNLNEQNFIPATHPFVIQTEPPLKPRLHKHPHP